MDQSQSLLTESYVMCAAQVWGRHRPLLANEAVPRASAAGSSATGGCAPYLTPLRELTGTLRQSVHVPRPPCSARVSAAETIS